MVVETRAASSKRRLLETRESSGISGAADEAFKDTQVSKKTTSQQSNLPLRKRQAIETTRQPRRARAFVSRLLSKRKPAAKIFGDAPSQSSTASSSRATISTKTTKVKELKRECTVCLESFPQGDSYKCSVCGDGSVCPDCIRDQAKRSVASKKPNAMMNCWLCHAPIPVSAMPADVKREANPQDVFRYHNMVMEMLDDQRIYCPKARCSTYITPRLYASTRPSVLQVHRRVEGGLDPKSLGFWEHFKAIKEKIACCPTCFTLVCTTCRLEHHGEGAICDPKSLKKEAKNAWHGHANVSASTESTAHNDWQEKVSPGMIGGELGTWKEQ
ncbi:hypothetical protein MKZ38_000468 [Zalerion maritima]|uniref:Uncharacterized protein n=1 Tax=Zalerion maritima TaxID=339359 RepID=A0AAD5RFA0_9PEZI|nr:hypothetical protein MKZ38_000468 [Zalerion maritima]